MPRSSSNKLDFLDILASTVHDTKNSLGILFNTMEEIIQECRERDCATHQRFYKLQYEIKRLNGSLVRLLSLYKAERGKLSINLDLYSVSEFLDDVAAENKPLLESKGIETEVCCPDDLFRVFDRGMVSSVLNNVLNNAYHYSGDKVRISARQEKEHLLLQVEDNGKGYPDCMIVDTENGFSEKTEIDFNTGSTGLGLYFSMLVAKTHVHGDKEGWITVTNGGSLGGGVFSLHLP